MSFSALAWGEEWGEECWDFPVFQFPLLCPDVNNKAYTLILPFSVTFELLHGMGQEGSEMLHSHVLFISLDSVKILCATMQGRTESHCCQIERKPICTSCSQPVGLEVFFLCIALLQHHVPVQMFER